MDESKSTGRPESVDDVIAHYGVMGMHWGVRKAESAPTAVVLTDRAGGKRIKTSGGQGHPATADARTSATYKQTAKKSSTDALSDQQLKALINRMNMEQQYTNLSVKQKPAVLRFVSEALLGIGKQQAQQQGNAYAAKKVAKAFATAAIVP